MSCGADAESCCTSLEVPGGTFYRTYGVLDGGLVDEADPATVSAFRLDKYEVTVARFRAFVDAVLPPDGDGGLAWSPPAGSGKHTHVNGGRGLNQVLPDGGLLYETGWKPSDHDVVATFDNLSWPCGGDYGVAASNAATWAPAGNDVLPINCVTADEAYAFCIWDGGFLPSLAEWEFAASAGAQQRQYPWGDTPPGPANQYAIYADDAIHDGCNYPAPGTCTGIANIAPVGSTPLGAGLWGQLDLVGDMGQLGADCLADRYPNPCTDCAALDGQDTCSRWFFGAAFGDPSYDLPLGTINSTQLQTRGYPMITQGIRCARSP
jgi:formylglycine-generating enzyme required for sulfatase activity